VHASLGGPPSASLAHLTVNSALQDLELLGFLYWTTGVRSVLALAPVHDTSLRQLAAIGALPDLPVERTHCGPEFLRSTNGSYSLNASTEITIQACLTYSLDESQTELTDSGCPSGILGPRTGDLSADSNGELHMLADVAGSALDASSCPSHRRNLLVRKGRGSETRTGRCGGSRSLIGLLHTPSAPLACSSPTPDIRTCAVGHEADLPAMRCAMKRNTSLPILRWPSRRCVVTLQMHRDHGITDSASSMPMRFQAGQDVD